MNIEFNEMQLEALMLLFKDYLKPSNLDAVFWKYVKLMIDKKIMKKEKESDGFDKTSIINILKHLEAKVKGMLKNSERMEKKRRIVNKSPIVTHPLNKPLKTTKSDSDHVISDNNTKKKIEQITPKRTYLKKNQMENLVLKVFKINERLDVSAIRDRLEDKGLNRSKHTVYEWLVSLEKSGVLQLHKISGYPRSPNEYSVAELS